MTRLRRPPQPAGRSPAKRRAARRGAGSHRPIAIPTSIAAAQGAAARNPAPAARMRTDQANTTPRIRSPGLVHSSGATPASTAKASSRPAARAAAAAPAGWPELCSAECRNTPLPRKDGVCRGADRARRRGDDADASQARATDAAPARAARDRLIPAITRKQAAMPWASAASRAPAPHRPGQARTGTDPKRHDTRSSRRARHHAPRPAQAAGAAGQPEGRAQALRTTSARWHLPPATAARGSAGGRPAVRRAASQGATVAVDARSSAG